MLNHSNHSYNLRVRKQNQTFNGFDKDESADDFGRAVSKTAKDSKKVRKSVIHSITEAKKKKLHVMSEDDE